MLEETRLIRQFLRDKAIANEIVMYREVDDAVGWPHGTCQNKKRGILSSALKWLEEEHGYSASCITGTGYRFFTGTKAIVSADQIRARKIVAQAHKLADTVKNCGADADQMTLNIIRSKLNFYEWALSSQTQKQIEEATYKAKEELRIQRGNPNGRTLLDRLAQLSDVDLR